MNLSWRPDVSTPRALWGIACYDEPNVSIDVVFSCPTSPFGNYMISLKLQLKLNIITAALRHVWDTLVCAAVSEAGYQQGHYAAGYVSDRDFVGGGAWHVRGIRCKCCNAWR